ncbi:MAG: 1,6-anhydro-N-acetylmuramyl-L-alanine amidase AmpD [Halioglobus sp.]
MSYVIEGGWLREAQPVGSPNCEPRPVGNVPELLVIHNISLPPGVYGTGCVERFFTNCLNFDEHPFFEEIRDLRVSAHLLIERNGALKQFVSFDERAWHAGQSCYRGRDNCNDFSIGIELEGTDDERYTSLQYFQLSLVSRALIASYGALTSEHIVGHSDIAPGRKTDPGPFFEWERLRSSLAGS